ncbi:uncharacterized protein DNG_04302 [Cephalotrichum gorgonifer]|uniref:Serine hydrolase domain-containing protein n=1 Tax=Cephalotrichum gorgonifer TaxID=2041049 RepID=A0AAE8MXU5_9PEZI|nr:uncharacterized protein DNG_04302 [Cephalotrichum gorgonifer]
MRFLCLHGRATSAQQGTKIFELQTARIRQEFIEHEFVFLNGGIVLQSCDGSATVGSTDMGDGQCGFLGELTDVGQYQDLLHDLVEAVQTQGPFDGVMGFSEGGIVAATLLLEDVRRPFANFKCGILFSAAPPLDTDSLRAGIIRCLDPDKDKVSVFIPTAHIYSPREDDTSPTSTGAAARVCTSPLDKLWSDAGWTTPEQVHNSLVRLCANAEVFLHDEGHCVPGSRHHDALRGALRAINRTVESASG